MRRAFNDLAGFVDRLGALPRLPDRHGAVGALPAALPRRGALGRRRSARRRGTRSSAARSSRRSRACGSSGERGSTRRARPSRCSTSCVQVLARRARARAACSRPRRSPRASASHAGQDWRDLAFALPLAMLAYTGLETVANLAEETREPGRDAAALALLGDRARRHRDGADRGRSGSRRSRSRTARPRSATSGSRRRSSASRRRSTARCRRCVVDALRVVVGISGALILFAAATTSISGITRLDALDGEHGSLPREFGRLERRALVSREAIADRRGARDRARRRDRGLRRGRPGVPRERSTPSASCIAFTAAQLAVIRLRMREPDAASARSARGRRSRSAASLCRCRRSSAPR